MADPTERERTVPAAEGFVSAGHLTTGYVWTPCCGLLKPAVVARPDWLTFVVARQHDMHMVTCPKARRARLMSRPGPAGAAVEDAA